MIWWSGFLAQCVFYLAVTRSKKFSNPDYGFLVNFFLTSPHFWQSERMKATWKKTRLKSLVITGNDAFLWAHWHTTKSKSENISAKHFLSPYPTRQTPLQYSKLVDPLLTLKLLRVCIFESLSGYFGQPIGWFSPSPSIVWQVSLVTGRLTNSPTLHFDTGPVHRVIWPVSKENDFVSKVPERESNSSYTARVDTFPSALSTRPTLLPVIVYKLC